jgi:hypothetical protein
MKFVASVKETQDLELLHGTYALMINQGALDLTNIEFLRRLMHRYVETSNLDHLDAYDQVILKGGHNAEALRHPCSPPSWEREPDQD